MACSSRCRVPRARVRTSARRPCGAVGRGPLRNEIATDRGVDDSVGTAGMSHSASQTVPAHQAWAPISRSIPGHTDALDCTTRHRRAHHLTKGNRRWLTPMMYGVPRSPCRYVVEINSDELDFRGSGEDGFTSTFLLQARHGQPQHMQPGGRYLVQRRGGGAALPARRTGQSSSRERVLPLAARPAAAAGQEVDAGQLAELVERRLADAGRTTMTPAESSTRTGGPRPASILIPMIRFGTPGRPWPRWPTSAAARRCPIRRPRPTARPCRRVVLRPEGLAKSSDQVAEERQRRRRLLATWAESNDGIEGTRGPVRRWGSRSMQNRRRARRLHKRSSSGRTARTPWKRRRRPGRAAVLPVGRIHRRWRHPDRLRQRTSDATQIELTSAPWLKPGRQS